MLYGCTVTWVLAKLVVEPQRDITSLMVIMLYCAASPGPLSQTGDSGRQLPPDARRWSSSERRPRSSEARLEVGLVLCDPGLVR